MTTTSKPLKPFQLKHGNFVSLNIRIAISDGVEIGEVHIHRRSGWRGGPSYAFHPNDEGVKLGFGHRIASSIKTLTGAQS